MLSAHKPRAGGRGLLAAGLVIALLVGTAVLASAHVLPAAEHADPEIFLGGRAWLQG